MLVKVTWDLRLSFQSMYKRETKMAVNKEDRIPIIKVVAKPRIGPVPNKYKITAVNSVVKFESKMAP